MPRTEDEVQLSYLTTAHIYGFISELVVIATGARVGYWQVRISLQKPLKTLYLG